MQVRPSTLSRRHRRCAAAALLAALAWGPVVAAGDCEDAGIALQVLGSGGPELDDGRASSSYLLWRDGRARLLVDAGSASSVRFDQAGARFEDLAAILLTHLHTDHAVDLPAYVKGAYFSDRREVLPLYGPSGNELMPATSVFVQRLLGPEGAFAYLSDYLAPAGDDFWLAVEDVDIHASEPFRRDLGAGVRISAQPVVHGPVAALAWRVDVGSCAVVFGGDTNNARGGLRALAEGADILVAHVGIGERASAPARRLFMTPAAVGELAREAGVQTLVLSHFMHRSQREPGEVRAAVARRFDGEIVEARALLRVP